MVGSFITSQFDERSPDITGQGGKHLLTQPHCEFHSQFIRHGNQLLVLYITAIYLTSLDLITEQWCSSISRPSRCRPHEMTGSLPWCLITRNHNSCYSFFLPATPSNWWTLFLNDSTVHTVDLSGPWSVTSQLCCFQDFLSYQVRPCIDRKMLLAGLFIEEMGRNKSTQQPSLRTILCTRSWLLVLPQQPRNGKQYQTV